MTPQEEFKNKIDDYVQTIHAIAGFMNFYRYDDTAKKMKDEVLVFQGRRLEPSPEKAINSNGDKIANVTPDIGVFLPSKNGVLGEVKKGFSQNQQYWLEDFQQLMSYDDDLTGWPSKDGRVNSHDIVLILHQTRAAKVRRFYEEKAGSEIKFLRPFIIVQFNRADERKSYYFFHKILGSLTEKYVDEQLTDGVSVPMEVFIKTYSTIKFYDSEPSLPYLIELIWTNVVLRAASEDAKFEKLKRNQKIDVMLGIDSIIEELHQGFSFRMLYGDNNERQPKIPKKEWVMRACERLVELNEASWVDSTKKAIKIFFRKYDDVLGYFIELCSKEVENIGQLKLFKESESE